MAYGHRREGDCEDIEVLRDPAPLDRAAMRETMAAISPRGKTPIGNAVERASEALARVDAPASVVVVTDGLETCGADLCALGETLAQRGTPLTAHVIGFDVADSDGQLACLANATGGRYLSAANADSLTDALQQVSQPEPAPEPEPAGPLFEDDFDRAELGGGWEVQNPDPARYILENGTLMAMTAKPGYMGKADDQPNVFLWREAELPEGDWEIAAEFTARMGEVKSLGGREAIVQVGRYADADNYIAAEIYRQGNSNDDMWLKLLAFSGGMKPRPSWKSPTMMLSPRLRPGADPVRLRGKGRAAERGEIGARLHCAARDERLDDAGRRPGGAGDRPDHRAAHQGRPGTVRGHLGRGTDTRPF